MSYLDALQRCNNAQLQNYLPWLIDQQSYGWIHPAFAEQLSRYPAVFQNTSQGIRLNPQLQGYQERTQATKQVVTELYQQGLIDTWVNEAYPVTLGFENAAVMEVERASASFFGIRGFGIHMNGLVRRGPGLEGIYVWVGVRAQDKPFWPGKLDQLVAGGQPVGISLRNNLIKEAQEEANIPAGLTQQAQAAGHIHYLQSSHRGLENSTLFLYDLWLPEDFIPINTDGEVSAFRLIPLLELAQLTEDSNVFKDNCNLVNMDLLIRMGALNKQHRDFARIQQWLYQAKSNQTSNQC